MTRSPWKLLHQYILSIPESEVLLETRGIRPTTEVARDHLESVGRFFLKGYHEALIDPDAEPLCFRLSNLEQKYAGFAFEGAAMACWLMDSLSVFRRSRWSKLLNHANTLHPYVLHVGVGWALARIPWTRSRPEAFLRRFDPLLGWLIIDGYGFHEGYFHASKWIRQPEYRPRLSAYGCRVFDQGLGRSLWFVEATDVSQIPRTISSFHADRHADLWSGVGLACAYAGEATPPDLDRLLSSAGSHASDLRQGVAFGAEARVRGRISDAATDRTCLRICGIDAESAAALTRSTRPLLQSAIGATDIPLYETWRRQIRDHFTTEVAACT